MEIICCVVDGTPLPIIHTHNGDGTFQDYIHIDRRIQCIYDISDDAVNSRLDCLTASSNQGCTNFTIIYSRFKTLGVRRKIKHIPFSVPIYIRQHITEFTLRKFVHPWSKLQTLPNLSNFKHTQFWTTEAIYVQPNTKARSRNHWCRRKAVSSKYSEFVFVVFVIQHAKRMRRTMLSSVACLAVPYFATLLHKLHDFRGMGGGNYRT